MTNILLDVKTVEGYEQRIAELEAELKQCLDCCKRVGELEGERDKLREALQTIADECEIEFQYAANVARGALKEQT